MDLCKSYKILHILPKTGRRIVWSWQTENGTVFRFTEKESTEDCLVEIANICVPLIASLVAGVVTLKYKCGRHQKDSRRLLPFHVIRTLLCMLLLTVLFLEVCESFLTSISLSSIFTILATFCCWILHRATEIRDGFGTVYSAAIFAAIGLSRAWKFAYLSRYGLSIEHIRLTTTAMVAVLCGLFAILDSYTLFTTRKRKRYFERTKRRIVYNHSRAPFLGRITFHWVIDLLSKGYASSLDAQDLGQLPEDETAEKQFEKFAKVYEDHRIYYANYKHRVMYFDRIKEETCHFGDVTGREYGTPSLSEVF
nr:PREDICTED: uncharacterized protein LOC105663421 [Megachile rotundata]